MSGGPEPQSARRDVNLVELRCGRTVAVIDPIRGSMLRSLTIDGDELLVPPFDYDGPIPRHGSFTLAPWVGEMSHGELSFRGHEFKLPVNIEPHAVHGLAFDTPWQVEAESEHSLTVRQAFVPTWPFGGHITQRFELAQDCLIQTIAVTAGARPMPVAFGWHPWFRVPAHGQSQVTVNATHYLELQPDNLPTGEIRPLTADLDLRNGRRLNGPETAGEDLDVVLIGARSPALLELPSRTLTISFDDAFSIVTVYTQPGFVCIEPWTSWPNAAQWATRGIETTGLIELEEGESITRSMRWSWS